MSASARDVSCSQKKTQKKKRLNSQNDCVHALKKTTLTPSDPTENNSNMQINSALCKQ